MRIVTIISFILSLLGWIALAVLPAYLPWYTFKIAFGWFFGWVALGTILVIIQGERSE